MGGAIFKGGIGGDMTGAFWIICYSYFNLINRVSLFNLN